MQNVEGQQHKGSHHPPERSRRNERSQRCRGQLRPKCWPNSPKCWRRPRVKSPQVWLTFAEVCRPAHGREHRARSALGRGAACTRQAASPPPKVLRTKMLWWEACETIWRNTQTHLAELARHRKILTPRHTHTPSASKASSDPHNRWRRLEHVALDDLQRRSGAAAGANLAARGRARPTHTEAHACAKGDVKVGQRRRRRTSNSLARSAQVLLPRRLPKKQRRSNGGAWKAGPQGWASTRLAGFGDAACFWSFPTQTPLKTDFALQDEAQRHRFLPNTEPCGPDIVRCSEPSRPRPDAGLVTFPTNPQEKCCRASPDKATASLSLAALWGPKWRRGLSPWRVTNS